jgi:AbiTii
MELLDQIIKGATGDTESLATLLRKCLVLASILKNESLKIWAESELNGYPGVDVLPPYRKIDRIIARGHFLGPFGSQLHDQPLSPHVLDEEHRGWATTAFLQQPIAAYQDELMLKGGRIDWPPMLTALYQTKYMDHMVLNRAWQEIAPSVFASLVDTVRTKILSLALELREQLGEVGDKPDKLAAEKVNQSVVYQIYGGNNIIAATAQTIHQAGRDIIIPGDLPSLLRALTHAGVEDVDAKQIISALTDDGAEGKPSIGQKTLSVIKTVAQKLVETGKTISVSAATSVLTQLVLQYLGSGNPIPN